MKKLVLLLLLLKVYSAGFSQTHLDQNGLKTSVSGLLNAAETQPTRYQIAALGYNAYHWQQGGLIIIELFSQSYATGYEKYILENGFSQGVNSGSPVLKLAESYGVQHSARIVLGTPYSLSTSFAGQPNLGMAVYLDLKYYATYRVRITYLQDRVDQLITFNQIYIPTGPLGSAVADFNVSTILDPDVTTTGTLTVKGSGTHSIESGSLGIGTTNTQGYKLAVAGPVIAESIKVKLQSAWPDYVFLQSHSLPSLAATEQQIARDAFFGPGEIGRNRSRGYERQTAPENKRADFAPDPSVEGNQWFEKTSQDIKNK